jgi:hypothetical protein
VALGYINISIDEGWWYSPSRKNCEWSVLRHMAMKPPDCFDSFGQTIKHIQSIYKQGLAARKLNLIRVLEILQKQLSTYGQKFFAHSVFTYTDPSTTYNIRETPVPVDNTKRCDNFCNEIGF